MQTFLIWLELGTVLFSLWKSGEGYDQAFHAVIDVNMVYNTAQRKENQKIAQNIWQTNLLSSFWVQ